MEKWLEIKRWLILYKDFYWLLIKVVKFMIKAGVLFFGAFISISFLIIFQNPEIADEMCQRMSKLEEEAEKEIDRLEESGKSLIKKKNRYRILRLLNKTKISKEDVVRVKEIIKSEIKKDISKIEKDMSENKLASVELTKEEKARIKSAVLKDIYQKLEKIERIIKEIEDE